MQDCACLSSHRHFTTAMHYIVQRRFVHSIEGTRSQVRNCEYEITFWDGQKNPKDKRHLEQQNRSLSISSIGQSCPIWEGDRAHHQYFVASISQLFAASDMSSLSKFHSERRMCPFCRCLKIELWDWVLASHKVLHTDSTWPHRFDGLATLCGPAIWALSRLAPWQAARMDNFERCLAVDHCLLYWFVCMNIVQSYRPPMLHVKRRPLR